MLSNSERTFIILRMQELTPSIALELLKSGMGIVTPAPVTVFNRAIGAYHPDKLGNGIDQDTQFVFGLLFVMNIGAGANVFQDRALRICERHGFDKEPAIGSGRAIAQALFHFIRRAGFGGVLPHRLDAWPVIGMETLHPSISPRLFGGHAGIVAPALICIVDIPIWSPGPDQLGDGIDQGMDFSFGSLARGDVDAGNDEILDVVVRIHVGGDRYLQVPEHPFPRANQGLETDCFSRPGLRDYRPGLLLSRRTKGPPSGFR